MEIAFQDENWNKIIAGCKSSGGSLWKLVKRCKRKNHVIPPLTVNKIIVIMIWKKPTRFLYSLVLFLIKITLVTILDM